MKSGRRTFFRLALGVTSVVFLSACRRPAPAVSDHIYLLEKNGVFVPVDRPAGAGTAGFLPWPLQVRVTDIMIREGKAVLAVNGCGLVSAVFQDHGVALTPFYRPEYFSGRTMTRLFRGGDYLFCHVYHDLAFPESRLIPAPRPLFGLVRVSISGDAVSYTPYSLMFQKGQEPWEPVGAGMLDGDTLVLEWKLAESGKSRFRYSTFTLADGSEREETREWFYIHATVSSLSEESDSTTAALLQTVAGRLARETPGCVVLFSETQGEGGADRRFLYRDDNDGGESVSVYHAVRVNRSIAGCTLLLEDGRFILAGSPDPAAWREGRLPELPADCRYTALGVASGFLCAAWEQVDFFRVGRAGIVIREGIYPSADRK